MGATVPTHGVSRRVFKGNAPPLCPLAPEFFACSTLDTFFFFHLDLFRSRTKQEPSERISEIWAAYHDERADTFGTCLPGDALQDLQAKAKKWWGVALVVATAVHWRCGGTLVCHSNFFSPHEFDPRRQSERKGIDTSTST